jgi:hypothetical protein
LVEEFNKAKITQKEVDIKKDVEVCEREITYCDNLTSVCPIQNQSLKNCSIIKRTEKENIKLSDLYTDKKFFTILTY